MVSLESNSEGREAWVDLFPTHQFPLLPFIIFLVKIKQGLSPVLGVSLRRDECRLGLKVITWPCHP